MILFTDTSSPKRRVKAAACDSTQRESAIRRARLTRRPPPHFHRDARATTQTNDAFNMELPSEPHERERLVHKMLLNQLTARPSLIPSLLPSHDALPRRPMAPRHDYHASSTYERRPRGAV